MRTGENIFKRKDGRWEARYHKGRSASGGILYGYCYGKTYTEAKQNVEYAKRIFENTETHNAVPEQKPMHWYCDSWLQTNRLRLRDSTYIKYRGFLDHHINPFFGSLLPAEVSSQTVSAFSDLLLETKGLSLKTVRDILSVLNAIFHYINKHFPDLMGVVDVVYPAAAWSEIRVLTVEEQQILTAYLLEDLDLCKFGILLALLTGVRIGEACYVIYNCEMLKEGYEQEYSACPPGMVAYNSADIDCAEYTAQGKPVITYFGNLGVGRTDSLIKMAKVLFEIDPSFHIDIYGKARQSDEALICQQENLSYHGFISAEKLQTVIAQSDILLHTESFQPDIAKKLQYAFSTKIAQCLHAGRCLLSYVPKGSASAQYLLKENCAVVATNEIELRDAWKLLLFNSQKRTEYAKAAQEIGRKNHDAETTSKQVRAVIESAIAKANS